MNYHDKSEKRERQILKSGQELLIRKAVKEDSTKIIEHMSFIGGESDNLTLGTMNGP